MADFMRINEGSDFKNNRAFVSGSAATTTYTGRSASSGAGNLTGCTGGTGSYPSGAFIYGTTGWKVTDTLAGGVGEVTYWTGGGRVTQTVPTSVNGQISFAAFAFDSGAHSDGPSSVKSYAWATTANNTGVVIGVANAQTFGVAVDMSGQNAHLAITPVYFEQNEGGSS